MLACHLGHQEVERVVQAIDIIFEFLPEEQWMNEEIVGNMLCQDLGYEDIPEFEDAIRGPFVGFLRAMPHIEVRAKEDGEEGGHRFRMKPLPPLEERLPTKLVYRIESSADLWRVCLKAPGARVTIPELEFEIGADGKRHVDTVYNHLAAAIWNLGSHVRSEDLQAAPESERYKIMETAAALNIMLDVDAPFTWIVHDPEGMSTFKPNEEGRVIKVVNPADDDATGEENLGVALNLVQGMDLMQGTGSYDAPQDLSGQLYAPDYIKNKNKTNEEPKEDEQS